MPLEARLLTGLGLSVILVYLVTPLAIRIADRLEFYDLPIGYKGHAAPTPYLGGTAVVAGFVAVVLLLTGDWERTIPVLSGVVLLWLIGTVDDRRTVTPLTRVIVEVALGAGLWALGLGWELGLGAAVDLALTALWLVAVINAFNFFDNMDGASSSMAAVVAVGIALLGIVEGDTWLAVVATALCGACVGFLPHNLFASPARIFLGDGGRMPIGFAVAALVMIGTAGAAAEWQSLAMGVMLVGVPALDTTLVIVSRLRQGIPILTGGRDHVTHRTRQRLQTTRAVALTLGGAQALFSALALVAIGAGPAAIVGAVALYVAAAGAAIVVLDTRLRSPPLPVAPVTSTTAAAARRSPEGWARLLVLASLGVAIGISPLFFAYYDSRIWVPVGLGLAGVAAAAAIARPVPLGRPAGLALLAAGAIAGWTLGSATWSHSVEQAVTSGNRVVLYALLLGFLLVLLRSTRSIVWLAGGIAAGGLGVTLVVVVRLLIGDEALFLGSRLNEPLGYVNGQASFFLMLAWCCLAAAEQRRSSLLAGAGAAAATLLVGLTLLAQSRGVLLAAIASALVVLAVVPGRTRRGWALVVLAACLALALPALLDVSRVRESGAEGTAEIRAAGLVLALASLAAGVLWGLANLVVKRRPMGATSHRMAGAVLVAGAVALASVGVASVGDVTDRARQQFDQFTSLGARGTTASSRLTSGAGNRYDYWRIARDAWRERPLAGVGAGNYDVAYFRERATQEDVRQPHSLELQVLSELGVVGALLLATLLAAVAWGAWGTVRAARSSSTARVPAVAAIGAGSAWLVHTSIDWMHLLPGVTALAIVSAAVLLRRVAITAAADPLPARRPRAVRVAPTVLVAAGLAVAGVSLARQGLAEHFRGKGEAALASEPAKALEQADRSLRLAPHAIGSYYIKAAAFARFNQGAAARATLVEAARREPEDFVTWALLGDLDSRLGRFDRALASYRRAIALNPRDPQLRELVSGAQRRLGEP